MNKPRNHPALPPEAMARILEVTQQLAASFDLATMLAEVVSASQSILGADMGALWLYEADSHDLVIKVPELDPPARVAAGDGLVGECLLSRQIINVQDCYADPRFQGAIDKATGYRTRTMLCVPLVGRDETPVGVLQLLNKNSGEFDQDDELIARSLAAQCAVALQRTRLTEELFAKRHLDEEVNIAREIQMATLPTRMPSVPGYDLHGKFLPTSQTGGDMFDLVMLDGQLFMLLGDATGHGFGPALSATQMQAMLRVAFRVGADLDSAFMHVNNQLAEDLPDDRFITAFMGFLDPDTHHVRFHSGGQGPILHFHAESGECEWHKPTSFPVGAMEMDAPDEAKLLVMQPGDILGLISDGVFEYENQQGQQFGEGRVAEVMRAYHNIAMADLSQQLRDATFVFGKDVPQADDITVVLLRRLPISGM